MVFSEFNSIFVVLLTKTMLVASYFDQAIVFHVSKAKLFGFLLIYIITLVLSPNPTGERDFFTQCCCFFSSIMSVMYHSRGLQTLIPKK